MPWPLSQDYNEAIQSPQSSFTDPELRGGEVATNALGLPMPCSGNFADVYRFLCPHTQRTWAIKCFTRQIPGLQERYQQISSHLEKGKPTFMVDFTFLDRGIQVRGDWYPIVKMQWVEGLTLNQFVKNNRDRPQVLDVLCQLWVKLAVRLREANIAHCDLQHGNVLLVPGSKGAMHVRLVDYDGMCVPALTLLKSMEVGHPSYQHPQRLREGIYSLEVDRFSHLVIYTALRSLMVGGPGLWERYDNGDNLLFCQEDFQAPAKSRLFYQLLQLEDASVRALAEQLIETVRKPLDQAPLLEELVGGTAPVARRTAGAKAAASDLSAPAPRAAIATGVGEETADPSPFNLQTVTRRGGGVVRSKHPAGVKRVGSSSKKWTVTVAVCVGGLLLAGLVGLWARSVFRVQTKEAVLVFEVNEPKPDLYVNGARMTVPWGAGGKQAEIRVKAGTLQVSVMKDGYISYGEKVTLQDGGRQVIVARLEIMPPGLAQASANKTDAKATVAAQGNHGQERSATAPTKTEAAVPPRFTNGLGMEFALVGKGSAWLGGGGGTPGDKKVEIANDFYLGVYDVTQGEWEALMGDNPSWFSRNGGGKDAVAEITDADLIRFPVESVSLQDAQRFIEKLNARDKGVGRVYRLPTEAEWEYACRGGAISREDSAFDFYFERPTNDLSSSQANFDGTSPAGNAARGPFLRRPTKVGAYRPNRLGVYDMHGNVWQWCEHSEAAFRVIRGGSWGYYPSHCRAVSRDWFTPSSRANDLGFRLAGGMAPGLEKAPPHPAQAPTTEPTKTEDTKATEVTLKGTITCAKCDLKLQKKCATVIAVKKGDTTTVYYLDTVSNKNYHRAICTDAKPGTVTGTVSEQGGKKIITVSSLTFD